MGGRECSIIGDVDPRPDSHLEGMLQGADGEQVPSQYLEITARKQGAPPHLPLLQEKNAVSLGHVLPTEMKVSTLVVFKHFLKNFLKIFMTVKVILCNRGTDAFDVSPFHFYLRTRLRHKLLGWAPGVPLVLWAPALVVPLVSWACGPDICHRGSRELGFPAQALLSAFQRGPLSSHG